MTATLLRTKLTPPPLRDRLVDRARLVDRLLAGREVPLTLISAPAGFGKTTAANYAARQLHDKHQMRLAWLSLQESDDDSLRFWRYVGEAFCIAGHGGTALTLGLDTPQPPPINSLLVAFLNELTNSSLGLLLVLDDYHLITQREIHQQVTLLIEQAPPQFTLWILTRADPPLPLHRLRARGQFLEIRAADLRFSQDECVTLLNERMNLALAASEISQLVERTEGWAAGLQLAALALQQTDGNAGSIHRQFFDRLAQTDRYILDYLAEEVLAQQPPDVHAFLLQTSHLSALCADLCDAVTQTRDSETRLESLAAGNLFIAPLETAQPGRAAGRWYRYHRLFADLLQGHLRRQQPGLIPVLHRRAATWYATHDDPETAIDHALQGDDIPLAARLIDAHARNAVMQGRVRRVEQWLNLLPEAWRYRLPRASLAFAWALLLRGQYTAMEPHLQRAESALSTEPALAGEFHALRAALAGTRGHAKLALEYAQKALAQVLSDDLFAQATAQVTLAGAYRELGDVAAAHAAYARAIPLCRAARLPVPEMLARAHLGLLSMLNGRLKQAEAATRPVVEAGSHHPLAANVRGLLALVLIEWNRLDEAAEQLAAAFSLSGPGGHNATAVNLCIAQANLLRARGDLAAAQRALEEAATLIQLGAPTWLQPLLLTHQVQLWLAQDAPAAATHALQTVTLAPVGHMRDMLPLAQARLLLYQRTPTTLAQARATLDEVIASATAGARMGVVIEARLLRALVLAAENDATAARHELHIALDLAQPEGYIRLFVDAGAPLAALLADSPHAYAAVLRSRFPAADGSTSATAEHSLVEPLTLREQEVLHAMARGLTYGQIADELIVSVNTVRHHVKGLYGKLQVNKATLAVEKAQRLGLL